ncbi:tyrosine-type recombinase/integrase [Gimesia panareensis]|uniref:tyrosine-type recombinase/integrase n=1 Tax=Gimesia panareensis TaxID=2527978 RepID=UPI00118B17FF|nr:phage integrase SAM-like domain-containing protein [Gimesia panareensis]QDU50274.1 Tyrosine recombinase XerC [Gimesia panareensis]
MASICKRPNGRKSIQFIGPDQKRKTLRLGKVPMKTAEGVKMRVESLLAHRITKHALDRATAQWLSEVEPELLKRLVNVGLVDERESTKLEDYCEAYYELRETGNKANTQKKYRNALNYIYEYFGKDRMLKDITPGDCDEWRVWLTRKGLAENTVRKHCAVAKVFFNNAVRKRLIEENPFTDLKSTSIPNKAREYFISAEETEKLLEACPDAEWRLIVALARFGGLRTPSEHYALRWEDVLWAEGRFYVTSPKTERYEGKEGRMVPIFPQLKPYLEDCRELADDDAEFVIVRHRHGSNNLRTCMQKIVKRAGLNQWPRLFQNMRSSRETELLGEGFQLQTVVAWLGNSPTVALKSYLQVREEDYEKATQNATQYTAVRPEMSQKPQSRVPASQP